MRGLVAVVVAAVAVAAAPAGADRAPKEKERAAIAAAAEIPVDCAAIRVSTVRHRYKWAVVGTKARCQSPRERALQSIYRRKRGAPRARWRMRWSPALGCDKLYDRVPFRVADDFGIGCADGVRG